MFVENWREGAKFQIPVCCRAHFCADRALGRVVSVVRWRQIATWNTPLISQDPWVPCGLFHSDDSPFSRPDRISRILAFNLALLLLGRRASWMRERAREPGPAWLTVSAADKSRISNLGGNGQMWWAHAVTPEEQHRGSDRPDPQIDRPS